MPIPEWTTEYGVEGSSAGAATPAAPNDWASGRLLLVYVWNNGGDVPTLSVPRGFTLGVAADGNPLTTRIAGQQAAAVFWKVSAGNKAAGLDPMPEIAAPAGGATLSIFHTMVYSGQRAGNPFHTAAATTVTTPTATIGPIALTTTLNDCLLIALAGSSNDDERFNSWSSPDAGVTGESIDNGWHAPGISWCGGRGGLATAGTGSLSSVFDAATQQARLIFSVASLSEPGQQRSSAVDGTGTVITSGRRTLLRSAAVGATGGVATAGAVSGGGASRSSSVGATGAVSTTGVRNVRRSSALGGNGSIATAGTNGAAMLLGDFAADRALYGSGAGTVEVTLDVPLTGATILVCTGGNLGDLIDPPTDSEGNTYVAAGVTEFTRWEDYGIRLWRCVNAIGSPTLTISQNFGQTLGFDECTIVACCVENALIVEAAAMVERPTVASTAATAAVVATASAQWVVFYSGDAPTGATTVFSASNGLVILDQSTLVDDSNGYVPIALLAAPKGAGSHQSTITHTPAQGAILGAFLVQQIHAVVSASEVSGVGAVSTSGYRVVQRASSVSAVGGVETAGRRTVRRSSDVSGAGVVDTRGRRTVIRSSAVAAIGGVDTTGFAGTPPVRRSSSVDGVGAVETSGRRVVMRSSSVSGVGSVQTNGVRVVPGGPTMGYATLEDLQMAAGGAAALIQLADWNQDDASDPDVLSRAVAAADGWIDAFLRNRYSALPIAQPSETLRRIAADEAIYWLRRARQMAAPEHIEQRKEREREMQQMSSGLLRPDAPGTVRSDAGRSAIIEIIAPVSRDSLKGMW